VEDAHRLALIADAQRILGARTLAVAGGEVDGAAGLAHLEHLLLHLAVEGAELGLGLLQLEADGDGLLAVRTLPSLDRLWASARTRPVI
jgi:hypothetical protein